MSTLAYASDPQVQFLSQLLEEIAEGHLLVPRFRRPIVWTDDQRLELMRSVAQATPIGSIMVWRTRQKLATFDRLGPYYLDRTEKGEFSSYLLDGHQRLSTLFGALKAPREMKLSTEPDPDGRCWEIFYDLERDDFLFADDEDEGGSVCVSLRVLLDSVESLRFQRRLGEHTDKDVEELIRRFEALAAAFQRYKIPIIPIVTDDLDQATRAFLRVNSQGTVMGQVHMVHALTWSEDFDLNSRLEEIRIERLGSLGWGDVADDLILTCCKLALGLDVVGSDVDDIGRAFRDRPEVLEEAADNLELAIVSLGEWGIESPKLLPYAPLLPMLAHGWSHISGIQDEEGQQALKYWFWWQVYVGLGGGLNYSRMRRAAETVRGVARRPASAASLLPPVSELSPLPRQWDFRLARAKALALRMAEWRDEAESSGQKIVRELSLRGSDLIQPLFPLGQVRKWAGRLAERLEALLRGPANRIVASPEETVELRKQMLTEHESQSHLIPWLEPEDVLSLEGSLDKRLEALQELEQEFTRDLGILSAV